MPKSGKAWRVVGETKFIAKTNRDAAASATRVSSEPDRRARYGVRDVYPAIAADVATKRAAAAAASTPAK